MRLSAATSTSCAEAEGESSTEAPLTRARRQPTHTPARSAGPPASTKVTTVPDAPVGATCESASGEAGGAKREGGGGWLG